MSFNAYHVFLSLFYLPKGKINATIKNPFLFRHTMSPVLLAGSCHEQCATIGKLDLAQFLTYYMLQFK